MQGSHRPDDERSEDHRSDDGRDVGGQHRKRVVGFERPSLLQDIRNILQEYPDDGQIFKEMIQNAEDARARIVKIVSVSKVSKPAQTPGRKREKSGKKHAHCKMATMTSSSWRPPFVEVFSMPGLCVYNDAHFTQEDWNGIRKLHDSVKVKDPLKVGRFGLGFKSVFHLTDHPVIISGQTLLFMDPSREEHEAIYMTSLDDLDPEERQALRHALSPLLHVLSKNSLTDEQFEGTVFWFPLRQTASKLSHTIYTQERVQQLKKALKSEINTLLLFLKRIERLEVFSLDDDLQSSLPVLDFSVGLSQGCVESVRGGRSDFLSAITTKDKTCPRNEVGVASWLVLETQDGQTARDEERWLVVNFHQGMDDMSLQLRDMCQRKHLTHRPYVGVAVKLNSPPETFQGQLFCFLPLPPEKPSPTGLPVHVHGFFELSQNRRHLKWPTSEEADTEGPVDDALVWNRLLITEVLPRAYVMLVTQLVHSSGAESPFISQTQRSPLDMTAQFLYQVFPHWEKVTSRWQPLLIPLYQRLCTCPLFFTRVKGGQWVQLQDAVVMTSPADELSEAAAAAVIRVYEVSQVNLVRLPSHVLHGLTEAGLRTQQTSKQVSEPIRGEGLSTPNKFDVVCPQHLSDLMKMDNRWSASLSREQKCLVLDYLCCYGDPFLLEDLELLPLADGTFSACSDHVVHVCRDQQDLGLLPGLHDCLCFITHPEGLHGRLQRLAESGFGDLKLISDDDMPDLLEESLESQYTCIGDIRVSRDDPWIRRVWQYLQGKNLEAYDHLPLLPCPRDDVLQLRPLRGNYVCEKVDGFPPAPPALSAALGLLGVHVVAWLPDWVVRHSEVLHSRVQPASCLGVLNSLARLAGEEAAAVDAAVSRFNTESKTDERFALVEILAAGLKSGGGGEEEKWDAASDVLRRLELFPVWPDCSRKDGFEFNPRVFTSVQRNCRMTPDVIGRALLPPHVTCSPKLLYCDSKTHRQFASSLGANEMTLIEIVEKILDRISHGVSATSEVQTFMTYFLESSAFKEEHLKQVAKRIRFVPTCLSGELRRTEELYNPEDSLLQDLFAGEDRFPRETFYTSGTSIPPGLKALGLRDATSVTAQNLIDAAIETDKYCSSRKPEHSSLAKRKAKALWKLLTEHSGGSFPQAVIEQLANLQCLPCVTRETAPADYPAAVPVCPEEYRNLGIARPTVMCKHSDLWVVGSVKPVAPSTVHECSITSLFYQPTSDDVIGHLEIVTSRLTKETSRHFISMLHLIYSSLKGRYDKGDESVKEQVKNANCILTEKDGHFRRPCEFWVQDEDSDDLDLSPYRFPLPTTLVDEGFSEFFVACGCSPRQDSDTLRNVLPEIRTKHTQSRHGEKDCKRDFSLVQRILKAIVSKKEFEKGEVLLPVYSSEGDTLQLVLAKDCTVGPDTDVIELLSEEEAMTFVHPDLDKDVALILGALDLRSRTLTGVDDLDVNDSAFGQFEPLTTRLRNLLQDGYTDGFSVPKELMQNADDAGAKVVRFLVDERENRKWRTGLLTSALADLQGPALWVFNDGQFSDKDFENLCKLGGATKKDDCSKVGKFGLGFNAVYNITEVPSVYSGSTLAMLDPHESYLDNRRGRKMNFNSIINKVLLKRMPNQFRPFHGVFGCDILDKDWKPFPGTLFRFPFRTESQAERSEICMEAFSPSKQQEFIRGLLSKAGNLMLFLQHVAHVELYRLSRDCTDPKQAQRVMRMERISASDMTYPLPESGGILDHFSMIWKRTVEQELPVVEHRVVETVTLRTEVKDADVDQSRTQECTFRVAWTTGTGESCDRARETREEGFVPLAAVGIPVEGDGRVMSMESCPDGFYTTGHLFCFLPLAREVSESCLTVHINAPFALTSDRRGLLTQTEDDCKLVGGRWNKALFSDPIPRAYLAALESVAETRATGERYYKLWPKQPTASAGKAQSPQSALFPHFYETLVQERFRVFLHHHGSAVPFSDSFFFDPEFKDTETGRVAFKVLEMFWQETEWRSGTLIDLPYDVTSSVRSSGHEAEFRKRVITEEQFFSDLLFPKIKQGDPAVNVPDRNQLVLHALLSDNSRLQELVRSHDCIPCRPDGRLRAPERLIHPDGLAAPLFSEDDGRFPQTGGATDFSSSCALSQLLKLGMVKDKISREELLERAVSVETAHQPTALQRAKAIIRYLPSLNEEMPSYARDLSHVRFLPVLQKPRDWPLKWFGKGGTFMAPSVAFSMKLKELVGCQAAVLDEVPLDLSRTDWNTLAILGVTQYRSSSDTDTRLTAITVKQLIGIAEDPDSLTADNIKAVSDICKEIYKYLNSFCQHGKSKVYLAHRQVMETLKGRAVVCTRRGFLAAECFAFGSRDDLEPYLMYVDGHSWNCYKFLTYLGVRARFGVAQILDVLKWLASDKRSSRLNGELVDVIRKMAELLGEGLKKEGRDCLGEEEVKDVYLPDRDRSLYPVTELCLNDCDWLEESDTMHFLHPEFSEHLAKVFWVRTKREHDEDEFCETFGQHEQLTTRINRLLEGYSRDASIFKELLQNADDAGATEVRFVKDLRRHGTEKLLNEKWEEVFGPALCIFNDACFAPRDMQGIQALGEGSKEGDALKTGKYGVGFNAVYNLTDTPCFWTRVVPDHGDTSQVNEKQLGEKLCVMDPNFFVASRRSKLPGQRLSVNDRFKAQYSNMLSPFLLEANSTQEQTGTLFRLPLRTEERASQSKIKQPAATMEEVDKLLRDFEAVMGESLLFLNNVRKVGVYTAMEDGTIELEYETRLTADESNTQKQREFFEHVQHEAKRLKSEDGAPRLGDFTLKEVAVQCCLSASDGVSEEWLVVNRFGLSKQEDLPEKLQQPQAVQKHRLLPLGGVALCLSPENTEQKRCSASRTLYGRGKEFSGQEERRETRWQTLVNNRNWMNSETGTRTDTSRMAYEVATPSRGNTEKSDGQPEETDRREFHAYCMLPLPVKTGLPVHVNGRFALDHETRRNVDTRPDNDLVTWNHLLTDGVIVPAYIAALQEVKRLCFSEEAVSLGRLDTQEEDGNQNGSKRRKRSRSRVEERSPTRQGSRQEEWSLISSKDMDRKLEHYSDFFPDHKTTVDAFWQSLMKSFYRQMAETEVDVFPVVRRDLDRLVWVPAVKASGYSGFFWNQSASRASLKEILKSLNMNIIDCPFRIHEAFATSLVDNVKEVDGKTVVEFLRSCHRDESETDSCNLKHLPKPVQDTAFGTTANVVKVFTFIHVADQNLQNLPLSLRMSEQLEYFTKEKRTIVSEFCDLLLGSSELFLHNRLIKFVSHHQLSRFPEYLRQFDIETLVELLPHTLEQSVFGCGQTLLLDTLPSHRLPFSMPWWVQRVWQYLDTQSQSKLGQIWQNALDQWSLIPALKGTEVHLFPLKDRNLVVYIPERSSLHWTMSSEHDNVNRSLAKLTLNKLYMKLLPEQSQATQIVASVQKPEGLLIALTDANLQKYTLNKYEAEDILDFFQRTLNCSIFVSSIRSLPFFERPDGSFIALANANALLCLPDDIPEDGLNDWSENRNISLVRRNSRLEKLYKQLGIVFPQKTEFYTSHLLRSISELPAEAIPLHMKYIRDSLLPIYYGQLVHVLHQTPFIKRPDGTLCKASDFFSPDCKVFKVMMPQDSFPPPPYDSCEWKEFLKTAGLVCEVSEEMFLRFARQVQQAGRSPVSKKVKQQSQELVRCMKSSQLLRGRWFLEQLKDVTFLVPLSQRELRHGDLLQSVHPVFQPPSPLVSFSEGFSPDWQFLVWTSGCVLSKDADAATYSHWETYMHELIGFRTQPPRDLVVKHVQNVCQSLSRKGKGDTSLLMDFADQKLDVVEEIMEKTYQHLTPFPDDELKDLQEAPIIFDRKRKAMFSPHQVVITILPDQIIEGLVVAAPETLGKFFDLFRRLGVCPQVKVDHYAGALERIHSASQGNILNPNELELVKNTVHNLFILLNSGSSETTLSRPILYLPAEDISMLPMVHNQIPRVWLVNSRELIFEVNHAHHKRVKTPIKGLVVFVAFHRLGLQGHDLQREARLLPERYRMKRWREVVKEVLMESCRTLAREEADTRSVTDLLQSEEFADIVKRLVNHELLEKGQTFTEDDAVKIEEELRELTVFKVTDLRTVLVMNGSDPRPETAETRSFFIVKERLDSGVTKVSLYVDSRQHISTDFKNRKLLQHVHIAVNWAVGFQLESLLAYCLGDLSSALEKLDEAEITPYHIRPSMPTVFPPPGSFVPEDMHFLLDNDVYEFKPREHVAYELYDPFVDPSHTETGSRGAATEGAGEATEQPADQGHKQTNRGEKPIYIFAMVTRVIEPCPAVQTDIRTRLLLLRYVIDVGDEERKEVEACELYKFIRPTPNVIVPFTGDKTLPPAAFSQLETDGDLKEVLKDIRRQLREIWSNLPDGKSRKRALKRLVLKWHPDKNPGRKEFCTKVFQQIQRYVSLLENDQKLPSDDEDDVHSYAPNNRYYRQYRSSSSGRRGYGGGGFYGSFFDNIFSRGRSYAESSRTCYGGAGSGSGTSSGFYDSFFTSCSRSRANPQPEEGRRWMRQAMQDLKAARLTLTQGSQGVYNWACYQAHQTAEKALKAVLYRRDVRHGLKTSHDICSIACCVLDTQIRELVSKLDSVARYHTRMRYPDFLEFPKIPSDVYNESEAREACDLAQQIIQRAQELFDSYTTPPPSPPRQRSPTPPPPAPSPGPSTYAIASSSSSRSCPRLTSSSSASRQAIDRPDGPPAKVPRLDPPMKALPPP